MVPRSTAKRLKEALVVSALVLMGCRVAAGCGGNDASVGGPDDLDGAADSTTVGQEDGDPSKLDGTVGSDGAIGEGGDPGDANGQDVAQTPPAFCQGIVLYASLDTTYDPEVGKATTLAQGGTHLDPAGRFAGGAAVVALAGVDPSATLFYMRPDGGQAVFPDDEGTISLWYRGPVLASNLTSVFYRPIASDPNAPTAIGTGLMLLQRSDGTFGLVTMPPGGLTQDILMFPKSRVRPFLRDGEYNQFVAGWRKGVSNVPTALLALNGGLGKLYDAGPDAETYADAAPNDAGDLLVPFRGYATKKWIGDASTESLRFGAAAANAPQGVIDDVAVWNRVLSFEEIAAVYEVNAPLWQVCKLR